MNRRLMSVRNPPAFSSRSATGPVAASTMAFSARSLRADGARGNFAVRLVLFGLMRSCAAVRIA